MSRCRTVKVRTSNRSFVASGWKVADLCRNAGLKPIYSVPAGGYLMDLHRLPDLLAHADHVGVQVIVTGGEAP